MTAPSSNSRSRRERLLAAAGALFVRWGFDKTSMDDIAREAGISKGAVYLEFPNKEALFKAVVCFESIRYSDDWLRRFQNDPGEWSFAQMFRHSVAAINANPLMKALLTRDQRLFGRFLRRDQEFLSLKNAMGVELFQRLQEEGAMRSDIPAPVIGYLMSVIGYGMIAGEEVMPGDTKVPFEQTLEALGRLLDRGLAPRLKKRNAGRPYLIAMVEKMQAALRAACDQPGERKT